MLLQLFAKLANLEDFGVNELFNTVAARFWDQLPSQLYK
jgi:hypothetical protein